MAPSASRADAVREATDRKRSTVPFVLTVLVLAVALSYARGGRLRRIAHVDLAWTWLLFAGVALQIVADLAAGRGLLPDAELPTYLILLASQVLVVLWLVANRHLPGVLLIGAGLLLNAIVMAANGAMPVDPAAMEALGIPTSELPPGKHTLLTDSTRLKWLADIWPVPPLRSIISVGDVVLVGGLVPTTHALMSAEPDNDRRAAEQPVPEAEV